MRKNTHLKKTQAIKSFQMQSNFRYTDKIVMCSNSTQAVLSKYRFQAFGILMLFGGFCL